MPVFKSGKGGAPAWCEMEDFEFIRLADGESRKLTRRAKKEQLLICRGRVVITADTIECMLSQDGKLDLKASLPKTLTVKSVEGDVLVFRAMGRWESVNCSGTFTARTAAPPTHDTPHDYEKTTAFDNHYHDCDEYWIIYEGRCRVASEGKFYDVGPGDCLATGMGWHHDIVSVIGDDAVKGVYFEGTFEGEKRFGHLWEPRHGQASPRRDRV